MSLDRPKSPKRILLATDLDPRSDRALDRAALLAGEFSAELFVAHVLEDIPDGEDAIPSWRRPPSLVDVARRQAFASGRCSGTEGYHPDRAGRPRQGDSECGRAGRMRLNRDRG